jgi:hypothetical protein
VTNAFDGGEKIRHSSEADAALSEASSGHDFSLQFFLRSEE